jgi:hypothetical protein
MTTPRKPRVDPLVPTREVDWYLGRVHVATPAADVAATIEAQLATRTDPRWTPALLRQTVRYALWRHVRNLAQYAEVMRGR